LPQWAQVDAVRLEVDGVSVAVNPVEGWLTVPVKNGTKIVYNLAPKLWTMPAQDNPNWVAFFYGSTLLAAQLNQNNIGAVRGGNLSIIDAAAAAKGIIYPASGNPTQWLANIKENLIRVDDPNNDTQLPTFQTANTTNEPLTLVPFYSIYDWRYAAYLEIADTDKNRGNRENTADYPIQQVPLSKVKLTDDFWLPKIRTVQEKTIRYAFDKCEAEGRMENFITAGKVMRGGTGKVRGETTFDDTNVYKIIEGAAYSLTNKPNAELDNYAEAVLKSEKLNTQAQQRGAVVQGRSLPPIPATVYLDSVIEIILKGKNRTAT
jgi:DUF1680 family protein